MDSSERVLGRCDGVGATYRWRCRVSAAIAIAEDYWCLVLKIVYLLLHIDWTGLLNA